MPEWSFEQTATCCVLPAGPESLCSLSAGTHRVVFGNVSLKSNSSGAIQSSGAPCLSGVSCSLGHSTELLDTTRPTACPLPASAGDKSATCLHLPAFSTPAPRAAAVLPQKLTRGTPAPPEVKRTHLPSLFTCTPKGVSPNPPRQVQRPRRRCICSGADSTAHPSSPQVAPKLSTSGLQAQRPTSAVAYKRRGQGPACEA